MKKFKSIKIIKNTQTSDYTFINKKDIENFKYSTSNEEHNKENNRASIGDKHVADKKKKAMSKYQINNDKGLKFMAQSQRNHSSIYE
ncbi:MAG TPA: hypothetical protein VN704_10205 [Verrucomicrobiae bacterium]|nr:hypothetical protein [Verrucomicrobiae bacterium]